ncbi:MAG: hypothetical protein WCD70_12575 [Alphaproteobacteria bacterium]
MNDVEFNKHLEILGLNQSGAAAMLQIHPRTVRRWQNGEQEIPSPIADLIKAWCQLHDAKIPWSPELELIWHGKHNEIRRHHDHALALSAIMDRVKKRGGISAPWKVSLEEHSATLGPMTVCFYRLANNGFSIANYRRSDKAPDINRDWPLIEDGVVAFAEAVGAARKKNPQQSWDE